MRNAFLASTSLCVAVLGLSIPAARAQTAGAASANTGSTIDLNLGSVVSTSGQATGLADGQYVPLHAPYAESAITRRAIRNASPAATAFSLLTRQPSIYANATGPNGVQTTVTFRGFNDSQFTESFDGVPLNDVFNAGVSNQASNSNDTLLTTNDFDTIDIYRGVNNPSVNGYDSIAGTIDYLPRRPTNTPNGEVGASYGSFNSLKWHVTLNTGLHYGVKQIFSFERSTSDGWTQNSKDGNSNLYYGAEAPFNDDRSELYGYFVYNSNAGLVNQLTPTALIDQYGTRYQFPPSTYINQNTDMSFLAVGGIKHQVNDILRFDLKGFVGQNDYVRTSYSNPNEQQSATQPYSLNDSPATFAFWLFNPSYPSYEPGVDPSTDSVANNGAGFAYHLYGYYTTTYGVQPSATLSLPFNTVKVGGNLTFGHLHSREYWYGSTPVPQIPGYDNAWNEFDYRTLGSAYVQDDIKLLNDRLTITPGLKYLWAETKDSDQVGYYYGIAGSVSNYSHFLSPTIGASLKLLPGLAAYFAYGKNIKFPEISSYYGNIAVTGASGAPIIEPVHTQPEYVADYEAGLRYEKGGFTAAVGYYRENFQHTFVTVTDPVSGASTTANGGDSRYDGVELQLANDFGEIFKPMVPGDFSGYLNYAHNNAIYLHAFTDSLAGSVNSGQPVGNIPNNLVSAGIAWNWQGWTAGVDTNYVGRVYLNNYYSGLPTTATNGGYFLTNIVLAKTLPIKFGAVQGIRFAINVDNLFGVKYYDAQNSDVNTDVNGNPYKEAIIGAPRAIYGSVAIPF